MNLEKYHYISFDIFDTLIKRNILTPKDVFSIVQEKYNQENDCAIDDFIKYRVLVEKELRNSTNREIKISQIYERLLKIYKQDVVEKLYQIECDAEINFCTPNQSIMEVYERCIEKGKKILIITDMYLDRTTICKMLSKCGYNKYDYLYISSEQGVTKESGELFTLIKSELQIDEEKWIHIGDNIKSDYKQAIKQGIQAKHISTFKNELSLVEIPKNPTLPESMLVATLNNYVSKSFSVWEDFGFEALGPILVGFANWLYQEVHSADIEKIYFLSRDGYIMKSVYELIEDKAIETNYLYASRRALQVPLFYIEQEYENVVTAFFLPRTFKLETFIKKLGLSYNQIQDVAKLHQYERDTIIESKGIINNKQLRAFYEHIKDRVLDNAKEEYEALVKYLKQNNFKGKVAIVDIGWFGNMQRALDKVVKHAGIDVEIVGYYMGLNPEGHIQNELNMKGYLFSNLDNQQMYSKERIFNSIFETLFLGNHGSVKKYYNNNGHIEVELYPYECEESEMKDEVIEIQKGAIKFAQYWYSVKDNVLVEILPEFAFRTLCKIGVAPNYEWAERLGDWKLFDIEDVNIARPAKMKEYLREPKRFIYDLNQAPWKVGFLKRVFKINLPYYNIWMTTRQIYKKGEKRDA